MTLTPLRVLKKAVTVLERHPCSYCLIGGHAASLYRTHERLTNDVDFALVSEPPNSSRKVAEEVILELGLKPVIGFIPRAKGEKVRKSVCLVTSTPDKDAITGIIDILLPELPWIAPAVARAQENRIDLGFARVPVITPEDLVIAKSYVLKGSPDRFQDLDDLKELFGSVKELDLDYLRRMLDKLSLTIPQEVRKYAPRWLRRE